MTIWERPTAVQLDLPLQPSVSAELRLDPRQAVKEALTTLLLAAAGVTPEDRADED